MTNLFPTEIYVRNFRSLADTRIPIRAPDGNIGSGLNLFIGENGSGKTSAIQILNMAFLGYSAANRLRVRTHSQNMTMAASAQAERKTLGQRS